MWVDARKSIGFEQKYVKSILLLPRKVNITHRENVARQRKK